MTGGAPFAVLLAVGVATLGLPPPEGATMALLPAAALGVAAGVLLFRVLSGGWCSFQHASTAGVRRLATIAGSAAVEEVAWRGFVLMLATRIVGPLPALVVSSALFALAHGNVRGRAKLVHVATGGVFGGTYLATGRLTAAIAAHAVYNASIEISLSGSVSARASPALPASIGPAAEAIRAVKRFPNGRGLDGVDLRLEPGEVLALLGPNGAGKSTLVGLLLGLRRPDAGMVRLHGRDPRVPAGRAAVGAVLQEAAFPATLRVRELIRLVAAHYPAPMAVRELLERFELAALARAQVGGLSVGQRRRLAVALAFVGRPRTVFLDEPTAGLDVEARRHVWEVIRSHASTGGSVFLTTHQFDEADALADRVAVIDQGRIVASGAPADLRRRIGPVTLEEAVVHVLGCRTA